MSLYPSLEDMKVDRMIQAQQNIIAQQHQQFHPQSDPTGPPAYSALLAGQGNGELYPDLVNYMGLELSHEVIAANMPEYMQRSNNQIDVNRPIIGNGLVAPLSSNSVGLQRAQVTNGIRELILCKGTDKKVGLRVQAINKGVFVCLVVKKSPAATAGLRFGDQILQINGTTVAGFSVDDVHKLIKKSQINDISFVIRDRPFERTVTLFKDATNHIGFLFKNGKITSIVKDSSAAKNGLLIEHNLLEVNGQNVVGMKDKDITNIIADGEQIVTITIIPTFVYEHMMKKLDNSFIRGKMDHSIPDI